MVVKTGMSMSEYSYERIMKAKPPRMNKSEWFETLMLKQIDAQNKEKIRAYSLLNRFESSSWLNEAAFSLGGHISVLAE